MWKKRQREKPAVDTQLVEIYEDLASEDETIRIKAAHHLLTKVVAGPEANGEQLAKILSRLMRGLCSGRKAARIGFSVALTEFLTELLGPHKRDVPLFQDISGILRILQDTTGTSGISGQEERNHLLGRLFGAEAIIQSGILFQDGETISGWAKLLDLILDLANRKAWLREECGYLLYATIQGSRLPNHDPQYAHTTLEKLQSHALTKTPEGVALWLAIQVKYPAAKLPIGVWRNEDPLARKEKGKLAQILKEAVLQTPAHTGDDQRIVRHGQWNPKVHFAWQTVLLQLQSVPSTKLTKNGTNHSKRITLEEFWKDCVDDNLFAGSSSEERKYWGFILAQQTLPEMPSSQVSSIFGQNFVRCLMNQLASPDRYLHRAAEKTRRVVLEKAKRDPDAVATILSSLLTPPKGDINFDASTRTKTVETLLSQATTSHSLAGCITIQDSLILRPCTKDEKLAESRRQVLADQLILFLRSMLNRSVSEPDTCIATVLSVLAKYAYFNVGASQGVARPEPDVSLRSREMFRSRLSSALSHMIANRSIDSSRFAYYLIYNMHCPDPAHSLGHPVLDVDKNVQRLLDRGVETMTYIDKIHSKQSMYENRFRAATLILSLTILQVYNGDVDAVDILQELTEMYNKTQFNSCDLNNARASASLVEILLSLVSKPSLLCRRLSQQVFSASTSSIEEIELRSMLKVLDSKENLAGQEEMFDQEAETVDGYDASDIENMDTADDASVNVKEDGEEGTLSDEVDTSVADSEEPSDESDQDLAVFDAKLAQALGTRPGQDDVDVEESTTSGEDMDDDQMEKLDEHLEMMFRERKKASSKKTDKKNAKETIVNFKCRVLELLDIYVKNEHDNILALHLILPILSLIRSTGSPLVSRKACHFVREYARICKGEALPKIPEPEWVMDLLRNVHDEAGKEASNAHASACSQASLLLVRVLVTHDRDHLRRIIGVYANTQERALFDAKFKVKTALFTDWLNWCNSARRTM
ncbi:MAG: hypothetical protein Q9163_002996 [Psora crenata]